LLHHGIRFSISVADGGDNVFFYHTGAAMLLESQ
jgi:hypothetical protein